MAVKSNNKTNIKKVSKNKINRKAKGKLGHDPLAWISDEDAEEFKDEINENNVVNREIEAIESDEVEPVVKKTQEEEIMNEQTIFKLPPYFSIAQVDSVKKSMQSFLQASGEEIEIESEDVESIDTAALQLLISFIKEVRSKGKSIKWRSISNKIESSIDLLSIKEESAVA